MKAFIIEDSPLYFKIYQSALLKFNYKVLGYSFDGKEGLEQVLNLKPELVIVDMAVPTLNGLKVGEEILTAHPEVFLIGVSGLDSGLVKQNILDKGFRVFIHKPFAMDELYLALNQHTDLLGKEKQYG